MSWIIEGFKKDNAEETSDRIFFAKAAYLADVWLAFRDAVSKNCTFIQIRKQGK